MMFKTSYHINITADVSALSTSDAMSLFPRTLGTGFFKWTYIEILFGNA